MVAYLLTPPPYQNLMDQNQITKFDGSKFVILMDQNKFCDQHLFLLTKFDGSKVSKFIILMDKNNKIYYFDGSK